jgi:hypothetical protein
MREANAQQIRCEFGTLVWKEAETVEDFVNRFTGLTAELRLLNDNIIDAEVVWKMLQVVPDHLTQVAISNETLLDIKTITVEEVTGMLRAVEQWRTTTRADCFSVRRSGWPGSSSVNLRLRAVGAALATPMV